MLGLSVFGAVEALEEMPHRLLWDADPLIADRNTGVAILCPSTHRDHAAGWAVFHSVLNDVLQDLFESQLVAFDHQWRGRAVELDRMLVQNRLDFAHHPARQGVQIDPLARDYELTILDARDIEQRLDQLFQPGRLLLDHT